MNLDFTYVGAETGRTYDPRDFPWRGDGGELLDLAPRAVAFPPLDVLRARPATLWRYAEALPVRGDELSLGEGFTPLLPLDAANRPGVLAKVEYASPTLSFKDRGAAVLVAAAHALGARHLVADSSGNAGTAIAAYAARARIACEVFVPAATSPKKLKQIAAHGATVRAIPGSREDTAAAAMTAADRPGVFYASHVYNPLFFQGTKTYAYELWEQLGGRAPDTLVLPVGNGTLVLGAFFGFRELLGLGLIARLPRFVCVQAEHCAPLARAWADGRETPEPVENTGTEAEGIAIAAPARGRQILAAVRATGGTIVTVPEDSIAPARASLAARGFYVEPTSAVNEAVFTVHPELFPAGETTVLPLCGAGLKAG